MTTQNEASDKAARVDEQAVRAFIAGHGPNGPTNDPELAWESEIDGWGTPGSADFAHSFETFLYDLQQHRQGFVLTDGIGCTHGLTPVLMEITTDSSGYADCFLVRTTLRSGAQVCSDSEELHHLAADSGVAAVLDALGTVAALVNSSYRAFVTAAVAFCGNETTTAAAVLPGTATAALPVGVLACPRCGESDRMATIERARCEGQITRDADGSVDNSGEDTDTGLDTLGVECLNCEWEHVGTDWAEQLVAATAQSEAAER